MLPELLDHIKTNKGLSSKEVAETSKYAVLYQFKKPLNVRVPIYQLVMDVVLNEWKDPDKIIVPRFMSKLYPLERMEEALPDTAHVDPLVVSLVGRSSMSDESALRDPADRKESGLSP
ncbi:hypothetical protein NDU88_001257 [Pleurodeles waltl]|uniref:Uncharacterized protein n=1 Tax=Pleurodeles waltl TaxID=8319 RepID=A0AAV7MJ74_PLEWA|nr:hypothetical protein NDU88_001257 [Pleurodeles waltl]